MRDLKKDKEISDMVLPIKPRTPSDFKFMEDAVFYVEAREGWPHAIERAITAEAEVERLRLMVKSITGGLDEAIETVHFLEAEVERLRKIIGDAREWMLPNTEAWKITCELDKEGGE